MEKTVAPIKTTPSKGGINDSELKGQSLAAQQAFIGAALNMSWQLAIVVLVPIVGGFKLDSYLNTSPLLTILGFVLAMLGMALVLRKQLQELSPPLVTAAASKEKKQ